VKKATTFDKRRTSGNEKQKLEGDAIAQQQTSHHRKPRKQGERNLKKSQGKSKPDQKTKNEFNIRSRVSAKWVAAT